MTVEIFAHSDPSLLQALHRRVILKVKADPSPTRIGEPGPGIADLDGLPGANTHAGENFRGTLDLGGRLPKTRPFRSRRRLEPALSAFCGEGEPASKWSGPRSSGVVGSGLGPHLHLESVFELTLIRTSRRDRPSSPKGNAPVKMVETPAFNVALRAAVPTVLRIASRRDLALSSSVRVRQRGAPKAKQAKAAKEVDDLLRTCFTLLASVACLPIRLRLMQPDQRALNQPPRIPGTSPIPARPTARPTIHLRPFVDGERAGRRRRREIHLVNDPAVIQRDVLFNTATTASQIKSD